MSTATASKKRKRDVVIHQHGQDDGVDTSKPTVVFTPTKGRKHTLSIAVPSSIIANALTHDQKTALAGQIARACAVFCVDEIVVYNDGQNHKYKGGQDFRQNSSVNYAEHTGWSDPDHFLSHVLSYLETPPFLRRALFPMHPNLKTAGALPSLDMPHHLRAEDWCPYREGITLSDGKTNDSNPRFPTSKKPKKDSNQKISPNPSSASQTTIDIGFPQKSTVPTSIPPNTRLTTYLQPPPSLSFPFVTPVHPSEPRESSGYYWGYTVRRSSSLSNIFTECAYEGGYDLSIGTSERGDPLTTVLLSTSSNSNTNANTDTTIADSKSDSKSTSDDAEVERKSLPQSWNHLLVVFGGPAGIEAAVAADTELQEMGMKEAREMFDAWVNVCPGQGSRTIRTEEAVWVGMAGLREFVERRDGL
ncbi:MAG: hypothetical protein M1820_006315 [Bogoriella megaspora]|nr:MAG: hypothetical protein M1820_006315 [Bogoriella megaspora]